MHTVMMVSGISQMSEILLNIQAQYAGTWPNRWLAGNVAEAICFMDLADWRICPNLLSDQGNGFADKDRFIIGPEGFNLVNIDAFCEGIPLQIRSVPAKGRII